MSTLWSDTFLLLMMGMGTVFVFLVLLILALNVMSSVIQKVVPVEQGDATQQDIAAVAAIAYAKYKN